MDTANEAEARQLIREIYKQAVIADTSGEGGDQIDAILTLCTESTLLPEIEKESVQAEVKRNFT